ncbi:MAG: BON domain-containing protein [Verrucomicrobiota bacterium]|nr:BON domain-containing protein [Verrucomicrobiota bacterium]
MRKILLAFTLSLVVTFAGGCSKSDHGAADKNNSGTSAIESNVKAALAADSSLQGSNIQVDASEKSAITLRGTVKSEAQIDRAKEIAMKDPSIKIVWSKLKVQ